MDKDERESDERTLLPARPAFADMAGQAEQAGLTLAMLVLGGLGMGSAAVLGAGESAV